MKKYLLLFSVLFVPIFTFAQTNIGNTTYDVQSNSASKQRIKVYDDGQISAIWTGSTDFGGAFPERGMFYNHYDGATWGAAPTARIEDVRTGFGGLLLVEDHEVILSHDAAANRVVLYANDAIGSNTWTALDGGGQVRGIWPVSYCPEGTDDIYVVNADTQIINSISFSRSDDGGATWSVLNYTLPYLSMADGFPGLIAGADSYQVVAHGSDVYVLFGLINSDLVLLHSDDYGNDGSWESTPIIDFPYDNYTGTVQSDMDLDGITDTINTTDTYHNMIIEDDGTVHVFSPLYRIYSDAGAFGYTINWNTMGMWHWRSGMAAAELIDITIDWVNDDCLNDPYAGMGAYTFNYRSAGNASFPTSAWDASSGRIYLLYSMKIEYTDEFDDPANPNAQSFHDIFGMYSNDGGDTWIGPYNLTYTAELGQENVYVYVNDRVVDGKVHGIWQQDDEPGIFIEGDPVVTNNILYMEWDADAFGASGPSANFSWATDVDEIDFTNLSTNAYNCYAWDFGDGETSTEVNPSHEYLVAGTYTVCLTASNPYGSDEYCSNVFFALAPDAAFSYAGDPVVDFTDLSLNFPTSWSWDFGDGGTSTLQNPEHTYMADGVYTVCLTATNDLGFNVFCLPVEIDSTEFLVPAADFSYMFTGLTASFTDISTNGPTEWSWDFGDGGTSTEQNPSHTYPVDGNYNVCLTATNVYGENTNCKVINTTGIQYIPSANIRMYPNPADEFVIIEQTYFNTGIIEIYNLMGQKMDMFDITINTSGQIQIDTHDLVPATYMVRMSDGKQETVATLVIE